MSFQEHACHTARYRWCEHCGHSETDPPFRELSQMMHAARVVNAITIEGTS